MESFSGYFFDVGGTLMEFDEARRAEAYAARAAEVGVTANPAAVRSMLQELSYELPERLRDVRLSLIPPAQQRKFWLDFWAEGFRRLNVPQDDARRFASDLLDDVNGGSFQSVFSDVRPTLDALRAAGKQLAIISNFSDNCEPLLGRLGLAPYFEFFVISGILGIEKPDPRIFEEAIRLSGRDRSGLVYIGDSFYHDVEGARAAGMQAVLLDRGNRLPDAPCLRVRDLRELIPTPVQVE